MHVQGPATPSASPTAPPVSFGPAKNRGCREAEPGRLSQVPLPQKVLSELNLYVRCTESLGRTLGQETSFKSARFRSGTWTSLIAQKRKAGDAVVALKLNDQPVAQECEGGLETFEEGEARC